ncbi:MAG: dockerin type I domain-containing protein [Patescibacteria group bacterium]
MKKKYILLALLAVGLIFGSANAGAQTIGAGELQKLIMLLNSQAVSRPTTPSQPYVPVPDPIGYPPSERCSVITQDLFFGDEDYGGSRQIRLMQKALEKAGVFELPKGATYGFFGRITLRALEKFQDQNNILERATGNIAYVGPQTRTAMNRLLCNLLPPNPVSIKVVSPNGGEGWFLGSQERIIWNAFNVPANRIVNISLITDENSGVPFAAYTLMLGLAPDQRGGFSWTVGAGYRDSKVPAGVYRMSICLGDPVTGSEVCDRSDSYFKIYDSTADVALVPTYPPTVGTDLTGPIIISSAPANGSVDARQPSKLDGTQIGSSFVAPRGDRSSPTGESYDILDLTYSTDLYNITADSFSVISSNAIDPVVVTRANYSGAVYPYRSFKVSLSRSLKPGERVSIANKPTKTSVCLGYLPGDVDGNGEVNAKDISALTNAINGVGSVALYQSDIDRSGTVTYQDYLRLVDLFNGAGVYEPWLGQKLPACPAPVF